MGMIREFREFAMRGNVLDLAVGIIIGAAFTTIVNSLVKDVLMPPLGVATGGVDFAEKKLILAAATLDAAGKVVKPEVTLNYGSFVNAIIQFLIVAFAIFLVVKAINVARRAPEKAQDAPPAPTKDQELLAEIRDLLRAPSR